MNLNKLAFLITSQIPADGFKQAAKEMNLSVVTLRLYARNCGNYPSIPTLSALARYLNIQLWELVKLASDEPQNDSE